VEDHLLEVICIKKREECLSGLEATRPVSRPLDPHTRLQATNQEPSYVSGEIGSQGNTLRYSLIVSKTSFCFSVEVS
jgi:hypothetical protein